MPTLNSFLISVLQSLFGSALNWQLRFFFLASHADAAAHNALPVVALLLKILFNTWLTPSKNNNTKDNYLHCTHTPTNDSSDNFAMSATYLIPMQSQCMLALQLH